MESERPQTDALLMTRGDQCCPGLRVVTYLLTVMDLGPITSAGQYLYFCIFSYPSLEIVTSYEIYFSNSVIFGFWVIVDK